MSSVPITHSYWVVREKFLAGEYPRDIDEESSRAKLSALLDAGFSAFIDLTTGHEGLKPYGYLLATLAGDVSDGRSRTRLNIVHTRFPILDGSVPRSRELTESVLDAIDGYLHEGRKIYLHCMGGVGRTGLIVGCWLARHWYSGEEALVRLQDLWIENPKSKRGGIFGSTPETIEQAEYVVKWNEEAK